MNSAKIFSVNYGNHLHKVTSHSLGSPIVRTSGRRDRQEEAISGFASNMAIAALTSLDVAAYEIASNGIDSLGLLAALKSIDDARSDPSSSGNTDRFTIYDCGHS